MKLFVGIDVSSKELEVAMLTSESTKQLFRAHVPNDLNGASEIKQKILELNETYQFEQTVIGMESTSVYSFHPAFFFKNDAELTALNIDAVLLNPRDTKRYKDIFEASKSDTIDAFYIADFLRTGHYTTDIVRQEEYLALQRLTRSRFEVVQSLTRSKQHFIENLYYKVNKLAVEPLGTSLFGSTMMELLTADISTEDLAALPLEDLAEFLDQKSRGRFSDPQKLAETIQKAIRGSYRLSQVVSDSVDTVLAIYANEIKMYQKIITQLRKSIEKVLEMIPEGQILQSIPGIGPVYSAGILAEIGQIERFDNEAKLAKYAGLAWKRNQSGNFEGQKTPMLHTGDTYLRYYLIEAANSIIRYDPVFKKYFDKKMSEIKNAPRKRALSLTARKLIRVIYYLLSRHQIYQSEEVV